MLGKHAAAGGVAVLTTQLGGKFDGSALVAEWNLGKVLRVPLKRVGRPTRHRVHVPDRDREPATGTTTAGGAVLVGDWSERATIYRITAAG